MNQPLVPDEPGGVDLDRLPGTALLVDVIRARFARGVPSRAVWSGGAAVGLVVPVPALRRGGPGPGGLDPDGPGPGVSR